MTTRLEHTFALANGGELAFSLFQERQHEMLHLHSDFTCSQFLLKDFGVQIVKQPNNVKVALWLKGGINYLSLYFDVAEYDALRLFFMKLG